MKKKVKAILYAWLEWLAFFPVFLWIDTLLLNDFFEGLMWICFPLMYGGMAILARHLQKMSLKVLLGFVMALGLTFTLPPAEHWLISIVFVLFFISALRGLQYSQTDIEGIYPTHIIWAFSLPIYFLSYIFYNGANYSDQQGLVTLFGFTLLFCLLFLTNKDHLRKASLLKRRHKQVDLKMRQQNYFYIILLFIVLLLLTRFNYVQHFLLFLLGVIFSPSGGDEVITPMEEPDQGMPPGLLPYSEPSKWAEFFDFIFRVIGWSVIIALLLFLLYKLLKKIPYFAQKIAILTQMLADFFLRIRKGRAFEQELGYQDETESVFDFSKSLDQLFDKLKPRFMREKSWSSLTEQEKARQLFRRVIKEADKQGFAFRPYETAEETLARLEKEIKHNQELTNWLSSTYNQARYSSLTIDQIEELKVELERNGWLV